MTKYLIGAILFLCGALGVALWQLDSTKEKRDIAEANVKAYGTLLDKERTNSRGLQLTVSQLEYFNDSILKKLDATRNELNIKDKQLKALHYVSSKFAKVDTIEIRDTLFRDPMVSVDTTLSDKWYSLHLGLKYPSTITTDVSFTSEKHIVVSGKKETVNPPKKWWILRIFQKKHTVIMVNVVEKNPYVKNTEDRYVEIIK
jgi:hypothetical protein